MKTLSTSAIALIAALGLGTGAALAEDDSGARADGEAAAGAPSTANMESIAAPDANSLKGKSVKDQAGEDVGDVSDVVTDTAGQQRYAVISVGDFLGIGGKDVAVPFTELRLEGDNLVLMSQNTVDKLEQRPEYKEENFRPIEAENSGSASPSAE
jgi:sporulation protein YlmC with PRC-barrel domain